MTPAPTPTTAPLPDSRDPAPLLERTLGEWGGRGDLWVLGYASLLWRPEFEAAEERSALVYGWHRALRMRSRVNRGTPERPGLVFALLQGGACQGAVYRIGQRDVAREMQRLWQREMPNGVYDPRWLRARTAQGEVSALAFTLSRSSPACLAPLSDAQMLDILRHARGRYGTTLEYLVMTHQALHSRGIRDREVLRLVRLAQDHGLCQALGH